MKVWVYVEGKSDQLGLDALWVDWKGRLGDAGWGMRVIALGGKPKYFRLIGHLVAEKLMESETDLVVGLPDLYPIANFAHTRFKHRNIEDLQLLQGKLVREGFSGALSKTETDALAQRFCASGLKHDLEMLLLAAEPQLRERLNPRGDWKGNWTRPPEDQDQRKPPKKIVNDLFRRHLKRAYLETKDAPAILKDASLEKIVLGERGTSPCPTFKEMLDWIGEKTCVPAY